MALQWISKIKNQVFDFAARKAAGSAADATTTTADSIPPPPAPAPRTWLDYFIEATPMTMLVTGGLLAACTQLIHAWALLGYMLIVGSPIVYWLRRIEKRLAEIVRQNGAVR